MDGVNQRPEWPSIYHSLAEYRTGGVYHYRPECVRGKAIAPEDLRPGTGGFPRCRECTELEELGSD